MIAYDRLSQIIPQDQALANKSLATSLQQITGITNMTLPQLAAAASAVQPAANLPILNAANSAVSPATADYYTSTLGVGSGANGQITINNILGTAIGYNITTQLNNTVSTLANMNVAYLGNIYSTMKDVIDGVFDAGNAIVIPSGYPADGEYSNVNAAFTGEGANANANIIGGAGLIPVASTEVGNIVAVYPAQTATLNQDWTTMAQQLSTEQSIQAKIPLDWANLQANSSSATYGLIMALPQYGQQTEQGGTADFIEALADTATEGGQAVVASLRQGINQDVLGTAGIGTINNIPAEQIPPAPRANLIPATYTAQQAANLVVK